MSRKAANTQYVPPNFCTSQTNMASQTCNRLRTCFSRFDENEAAIRLRLVPWPLTFQMKSQYPASTLVPLRTKSKQSWSTGRVDSYIPRRIVHCILHDVFYLQTGKPSRQEMSLVVSVYYKNTACTVLQFPWCAIAHLRILVEWAFAFTRLMFTVVY